MTRPGYRMTEIGEIPEEWEFTKLGDPKIINKMKAGGTPLKSVKTYYENGTIPFVKIEDIVKSSKYLTSTLEYITEEGLKNSSSWLSPKDSILFSMYASYGEVCINKIPVTTNQAIITIVPNRENVDITFLYYELKSLKSSLKQYLRSTTQSNLNAEIVKGLKMAIPPFPEHEKIAEILSTADETIQKVNEEITLTEKLKKGLMQTLLTKGIGHTKFKMTEIGEIPEEWKLKSISDCTIPTNTIDPYSVFGNSNFHYIDVSAISSENLEIIDTKEIQGLAAPSRARKEVKKDDVLFATVRPYLKRVAIVPKYLDGNVCSTAFCVVRANRKEILPKFLFYYMTLDKFVNRLSGVQTGSAYPAVSDKQVISQRIAIPELHEQQKITEILTTVDEKLKLLRNKREYLEKLKKGLMGELLTGRVRVKV